MSKRTIEIRSLEVEVQLRKKSKKLSKIPAKKRTMEIRSLEVQGKLRKSTRSNSKKKDLN